MKKRLTAQERADLIIQHKSERDGRIRDRIKAVLLYDKGYSYMKVAAILLLDDETIRRHVSNYFLKNQLAPKNGGSVSHISLKDSERLKAHLRENRFSSKRRRTTCGFCRSVLQYSVAPAVPQDHRPDGETLPDRKSALV